MITLFFFEKSAIFFAEKRLKLQKNCDHNIGPRNMDTIQDRTKGLLYNNNSKTLPRLREKTFRLRR
jgi:hypothetical protein